MPPQNTSGDRDPYKYNGKNGVGTGVINLEAWKDPFTGKKASRAGGTMGTDLRPEVQKRK